MAPAAPPEGMPPRPAAGETAPLVDEDPAERAKAELRDAERRQERWAKGGGGAAAARKLFKLTVQPAVGGGDAAFTLENVSAAMKVGELRTRIEAANGTAADAQVLFIVDKGQEPLEDETLELGAYGVVEGVTLHLAMQNAAAAAARRAARIELRALEAAEKAAREAAAAATASVWGPCRATQPPMACAASRRL